MDPGDGFQREAGAYHKSKNCATTQDKISSNPKNINSNLFFVINFS